MSVIEATPLGGPPRRLESSSDLRLLSILGCLVIWMILLQVHGMIQPSEEKEKWDSCSLVPEGESRGLAPALRVRKM